MTGKKIIFQNEAINGILVVETNSESDAEVSDVEHDFEEEEEEEEENDDDNKPQHKSKHRLQQVMDYQPGDRLKEGTQIFIVLSVQQEV
jgi:tRNA U34 5-carboxymethylaminomethyl modifying GTPase MnmE/TrmE